MGSVRTKEMDRELQAGGHRGRVEGVKDKQLQCYSEGG